MEKRNGRKKGREGIRILDAIVPNMEEWLDRSKKVLTYHMTQVITGHGCFNAYLHRIGKEDSKACAHCVADVDDAQHTLEHCEQWEEEREQLKRVLGSADLSLRNVIKLISEDQDKWEEFGRFCGQVMTRKEEDERIRRGERETRDNEGTGSGRSEEEWDSAEEDNTDNLGSRLERVKKKIKIMERRKKKRWKTLAHLR